MSGVRAHLQAVKTVFAETAGGRLVSGRAACCGAVMAFAAGRLAVGHAQIRRPCAALLAGQPSFSSAGQQPPIRNRDPALTSTRLPANPTTAGGG
jgi:hypothetical protein